MAAGLCDVCGEEPAKWLMHDTDTGDVRGMGMDCLPMVGLGMVAAMGEDAQDAIFANMGYQPTAAVKKARKAALDAAETDPNRTIVEIVESAPRDDDDDQAGDVDTATQPPADESTNTPSDAGAAPAATVEPLTPTGPTDAAGEAGDNPPPY